MDDARFVPASNRAREAHADGPRNRILCRVQAHPSRAELHQRLLPQLKPLPTELMLHSSEPPDPWANYKRCLSDIPTEFTHVLVAQDDVMPQPGFVDAVQSIGRRWPDAPVCLFLGAYPAACASRVRRAKPEVRYLPLGPSSYVPLVCVLWPVQSAREFLRWAASSRAMTRADDGNAGKWARGTRQQIMVTIPSLVQHDDDAASVKGGRDHVPWQEKWRFALYLADDCTEYDW